MRLLRKLEMPAHYKQQELLIVVALQPQDQLDFV